jgi:hypothetical protein
VSATTENTTAFRSESLENIVDNEQQQQQQQQQVNPAFNQ